MVSRIACVLVLFVAVPVLADEPDAAARERAQAELAVGEKLLEGGDPEKALERFRAAAEALPDDAKVRAALARAHGAIGRRLLAKGQAREAARELHEAATLDPKELEHAHGEGLALAEAGDDRGAVAVLEGVLREEPKRRATLVALGRSLYRLGKLDLAIQRWALALELEPRDEALARALAKARREVQVEGDLLEDLGAPHFTIRVDGARDADLGRLVGRYLEDAWRDVGYDLGRYPDGEVPVVIYPRRTFRATTGLHGWVAAVYDGKIRIPSEGLVRADPGEVKSVLAHELTHAIVRSVGGPDVPGWLHEGLAQLEEGRVRADARALCAKAESLPSFDVLARTFASEPDAERARLRYAIALDFTGSIVDRSGKRGVMDVLDRLKKGEKLDEASKAVLGSTPSELYEGWKAGVRR